MTGEEKAGNGGADGTGKCLLSDVCVLFMGIRKGHG